MQYIAGAAGWAYNRRKSRSGSFWSGRYHPALVETGSHLFRCLFYIDMNRVRARAVEYPSQWRDCGVHELLGIRQRYRILNLERLLWCLGMPGQPDDFRRWYQVTLDELSRESCHVREPMWSECAAVGSRDWTERLGSKLVAGRQAIREVHVPGALTLADESASWGLSASRRATDGLLF